MEEPSIIVKNVSKSFKISNATGIKKLFRDKKTENTIKALDDISFTVPQGESLGIIGLNGSGKTTLLRIIAGLIKPDSGTVNIHGTLSPLLHLGTGFQEELDAKDNVIMNGLLLGFSKSQIEKKLEDIIGWAELERFSQMKLKHFSTGMRARLAFSIAIQVNPEILLLDEITSVGDRIFKEKSQKAFLSFRENKRTLLHATHVLGNLVEFTDRVLLLHNGKTIALDKPDKVIQKYKQLKPHHKNTSM